MNLSIIVLCWIATSTILGILFGYSPLGLTRSTAIIALVLGLLLPGIPALRQLTKRGLEPMPRQRFFAYVVSIVFLAFAAREFSQVIFVTRDQIRVISPNNLGDI